MHSYVVSQTIIKSESNTQYPIYHPEKSATIVRLHYSSNLFIIQYFIFQRNSGHDESKRQGSDSDSGGCDASHWD